MLENDQIIKIARDRGKRQGLRGSAINFSIVKRTAKQFGSAAELYIQAYCSAHQKAFDNLTPEERIIRRAKTAASKRAQPINETLLRKKHEDLTPLYMENFLTAYQNRIAKKPIIDLEKEKYKEHFAVFVLTNLKYK